MNQHHIDPAGGSDSSSAPHRTHSGIQPKPLWLVLCVSIALLTIAAVIRFRFWHEYFVPIGYAVPLLIFLWLRDRRFLWGVAACFWLMTWYKLYFILQGAGGGKEYPFAPV